MLALDAIQPPTVAGALEHNFDAVFTTKQGLREKQIQQNYRPVIGIHKWFARRPGTVFRSLLLAEFCGEPVSEAFWRSHRFDGVIGDPFMGGGTPLYEANRLGFHVVGSDINPMAHWIVGQALCDVDCDALREASNQVVADVETKIGSLYETDCLSCGSSAPVKYFIWVKTAACPACSVVTDLFPGHLLAKAVRHPMNVLVCPHCGTLNEYGTIPTASSRAPCIRCEMPVQLDGALKKRRATCGDCETVFPSGQCKEPTGRRL